MTIWSARFPAKPAFHARSALRSGFARRAVRLWLLDGRGADLADADGRRRDAAHRIRPVDRRVEAGDRRAAAAVRGRLAGRIREIPSDPAIPRTQPRHEPRRSSRSSIGGNGRIGCWRARPGRCSCCRFCFSSGAAGFRRRCGRGCGLIFAGGAALGAVGWWMVSSGLAGSTLSVSQYRLAFHLTLACAIYAAILWTAQQIAPRRARRGAPAAAPRRAGDRRVGAGADLSRRVGRRARCGA